jgi:hypothetical protein
MKHRFYLLSLALLALFFLSQSRAVMAGSMSAPADGDEEVTDSTQTDTLVVDSIVPVAIVNGDSLFASLTQAFYSATDTAETNIQLLADVPMGVVVIKEGVTVSLDLNGYKVTIDSLGIYNYGKLSITDGSETGSGSILLDRGNVSMIYNYGELTIDGGSYVCSSAEVSSPDFRRCLITFDSSKTYIKKGSFNSTGQALCVYGELTIDTGEFVTTGNTDVVASYAVDKQLVINGGVFSNAAEKPAGTDWRRCLWTNAGTKTLIKDGMFTSENQVLFLQGETTIDGGDFTSVGNASVVRNYSMDGQLTINGGSFQNLGSKPEEGSDQRCCLFSNVNTKTVIADASFSSTYQVLVFNGDAIINSGIYTTNGNINVIGNYNTLGELVINGGTFTNNCVLPEFSEDTDNRRCLWASKGTTTTINDGTLTNNATAQTITIYGTATVNGGTITNNGHGSGIASNGSVEITGCRISAWNMLICWEGATLVCSGGLFSEPIPEELLAEGCQCVENKDAATKDAYPYKVVKGKPGDVNGDGTVDVADISTVISVMAGSESEETEKAADVNGDGIVDVADISTVISIMAGE